MGSTPRNVARSDDDTEKQHIFHDAYSERPQSVTANSVRTVLKHVFHWSIALLAMAVAAWCLLGAFLLCYGNYTSPWPRQLPCAADGLPNSAMQDAWCHTQNDGRPLALALTSGCPSIGAQVWLSETQEVVVGHGPNQTFASMYVKPLLELLGEVPAGDGRGSGGHAANTNSLLEAISAQEFILVLNLVGNSTALWPLLHRAIAPLRQAGLLTHFDGLDIIRRPVTVVTDFGFKEIISQGAHRDIFFDAPLEVFSASEADGLPYQESLFEGRSSSSGQTPIASSAGQDIDNRRPKNPAMYSVANSYYATGSFKESIGQVEGGNLSNEQLDIIYEQVQDAHARGLKVRYVDLPPTSETGWKFLQQLMWEQGVDVVSISSV